MKKNIEEKAQVQAMEESVLIGEPFFKDEPGDHSFIDNDSLAEGVV